VLASIFQAKHPRIKQRLIYRIANQSRGSADSAEMPKERTTPRSREGIIKRSLSALGQTQCRKARVCNPSDSRGSDPSDAAEFSTNSRPMKQPRISRKENNDWPNRRRLRALHERRATPRVLAFISIRRLDLGDRQ
jgi:hypothetical protein